MNVDERGNNDVKITEKRFGCLQVIGLLLVVAAVTAGMTLFVVKTYLFPLAVYTGDAESDRGKSAGREAWKKLMPQPRQ